MPLIQVHCTSPGDPVNIDNYWFIFWTQRVLKLRADPDLLPFSLLFCFFTVIDNHNAFSLWRMRPTSQKMIFVSHNSSIELYHPGNIWSCHVLWGVRARFIFFVKMKIYFPIHVPSPLSPIPNFHNPNSFPHLKPYSSSPLLFQSMKKQYSVILRYKVHNNINRSSNFMEPFCNICLTKERVNPYWNCSFRKRNLKLNSQHRSIRFQPHIRTVFLRFSSFFNIDKNHLASSQ